MMGMRYRKAKENKTLAPALSPSRLPEIGISQHRLLLACPLLPLSSPHPLTHFPSFSVQKMSVTLQPSNSIGFNRVPPLYLPVFPFSHTPIPRSFDPERETFLEHHKSQCRSCLFQNKDHSSQGAPFPRSNSTALTCLPSCTAYGPTLERSTQDRQLKFKVQYVFYYST
jgi:hypothetical protein